MHIIRSHHYLMSSRWRLIVSFQGFPSKNTRSSFNSLVFVSPLSQLTRTYTQTHIFQVTRSHILMSDHHQSEHTIVVDMMSFLLVVVNGNAMYLHPHLRVHNGAGLVQF